MESLHEFVMQKVKGEISGLEAALRNRQSDLDWLDIINGVEPVKIAIEVKIESVFKSETEPGVCMIEGGDPKEIVPKAIAKFKKTHDGRDPISLEITVCAVLPNGTRVQLPEEFYR